MLCRSRFLRLALGCALLVAALSTARWWRHRGRNPLVAPLRQAPFFADEFDGAAANPVTQSGLNPLKWQVQANDQILQRTQWGLPPALQKDADGTSFVRLGLQTFNPRPGKAGRFHQSTQITSLSRWNLKGGIEIEARLRADHLPPGLILGFFAYGDAGVWKKTYQKTEADFEFLSHQGGKHIWTHLWDNWNPLREGENAGILCPTAGPNWNDGTWNIFKIRWTPNYTQWICNDRLIREERAVRPGSPMGVWFNLWAPNPDWLDAYDPAIQPSATLAGNRSYFYDVDYVRVRRMESEIQADGSKVTIQKSGASRSGSGVTENVSEVAKMASDAPEKAPLSSRKGSGDFGHGQGLKASYFANENLQGRAIVRLDPRVDFDWGRYSPDSRLPLDRFSARWEGFIEAPATETMTFSVVSDDGARLWVGGKQILDCWRQQGPAPRARSVQMKAGKRVPIRLEMFNHQGIARAQLSWQSRAMRWQIVPQSRLSVGFRPAPPRFFPDSRALLAPQNVRLLSPTRGAIIRYTLDGKPPSRLSKTLRNGASLRIGYSTLVRAEAFLEGEVPSESAAAFYELDDAQAPQLLVASPAPGARAAHIGVVSGQVSDGGSGVSRVDLVITRLSDGLKWKEGRWTREEWGIGAVIEGQTWSVRAGLPPARDLPPGRYELKAVAYDGAGNVSGARRELLIVAPKTSAKIILQ